MEMTLLYKAVIVVNASIINFRGYSGLGLQQKTLFHVLYIVKFLKQDPGIPVIGSPADTRFGRYDPQACRHCRRLLAGSTFLKRSS